MKQYKKPQIINRGNVLQLNSIGSDEQFMQLCKVLGALIEYARR